MQNGYLVRCVVKQFRLQYDPCECADLQAFVVNHAIAALQAETYVDVHFVLTRYIALLQWLAVLESLIADQVLL